MYLAGGGKINTTVFKILQGNKSFKKGIKPLLSWHYLF
jgi:hypothetical protein